MNKAFIEDLIKAQSEIKPIKKTGKNPHFKSEYADYDHVIEECKRVCHKYNMFISHSVFPGYHDGSQLKAVHTELTILRTTIYHTSGELIESMMPLLNKAGTDQGMGSSISYAKRYTIQSLLAVSTHGEDDDGEGANKSNNETHNYASPPLGSSGEFDNEISPALDYFDALPTEPPGKLKIPDSVKQRLEKKTTLHIDGNPEHIWRVSRENPNKYYCCKKIGEGLKDYCKEQKIDP